MAFVPKNFSYFKTGSNRYSSVVTAARERLAAKQRELDALRADHGGVRCADMPSTGYVRELVQLNRCHQLEADVAAARSHLEAALAAKPPAA